MAKKVKEEAVVEVVPEAVPFKNTATGKTVRTFLQGIAGVLLVFLLSDEFRTFVQDRYPELLGIFPLAVALFTFLQNFLDPNTPNI